MLGMISGMLKQRIEKYQEIVKCFLTNQELLEDQKAFLVKEKVMKGGNQNE